MSNKSKLETTQNNADQSAPGPDPFNVEALRLPPTYVETAGIKKVVTTVPVRKPHVQEWFRVNPDPTYRGDFGTICLKDERNEFYLVAPSLLESLRNELIAVTIYTVINKNGTVLLWPVKLAGSDRRSNSWNQSAHEAAEAAMKRMVRMKANMSLGAYEITYSDSPIPENDPVWPDLTFTELLQIAFQKTGCFVTDFDHPVIKMLRGL